MSLSLLTPSFTRASAGALALALVALTSSAAHAAVTLIDQKIALAGKVTAGDAPGFPVTISEPGSYRLNSNLVITDASLTVIDITANDVTLDLNGFSIIGPNSCTGTPVQCTIPGGGIGIKAAFATTVSPANVRVMNGTVRGMGSHGIRMMGDNTTVEKVQSVSNGGPGIVVGQGAIIDSYASQNGSGAAVVGLIVRGTVSTKNVFGIFIRPGGVGTGNSALSNAATGFSAQCPAVVVGNTSTGNGQNYDINGTCALADLAQ